FWHVGGPVDGLACDDVEARVGLGQGRDVRCIRQMLGADAGDQLEVTGDDITLGGMPDVEQQWHPVGHDVGQRRGSAAIRYVLKLPAVPKPGWFPRQMAWAWRARRGKLQTVRALPG